MHYTLLQDIDKQDLVKVLPKSLFQLVNLNHIKEEKVNLVFFPVQLHHNTVNSRMAGRIIQKTQHLSPIIVIIEGTSLEAAELLKEYTPYFFHRTEWTFSEYEEQNKGYFTASGNFYRRPGKIKSR